jgi:NADPH:quinone reductase-like Zn-dependent oxidoreductase
MRAVRFDQYGGVDVLNVVDVPDPVAGDGQVLVEVKAAGINPGEAKIRDGSLAERWPATFPSGQGSDLAGVVRDTGAGVTGVASGDQVFGWVDNRSSHAELVVVDAIHLNAKPFKLDWEIAGSLFVAGATGWATVHAVELSSDDTVVISGAAGGVGVFATQLAVRTGARVIGLASEANHQWLRSRGVIPVTYGDGVDARIRDAASSGVNAFIDLVGGGYVELAFALGVDASRIDTVVDFAAASRGVKTDGSAVGARSDVLLELAESVVSGDLEIPIAATFPLEQVRDAYLELEQGHTRGKIVLVP